MHGRGSLPGLTLNYSQAPLHQPSSIPSSSQYHKIIFLGEYLTSHTGVKPEDINTVDWGYSFTNTYSVNNPGKP